MERQPTHDIFLRATNAAAMMLVDEGKVNVDDPVEKYLPEFRGQMVVVEKDAEHVLLRRPSHPITVKNVLSHTSGLPFQSALEEPTLDLFPLAARVRSYAMTPLEFEPDSKYQYSNAGMNTAKAEKLKASSSRRRSTRSQEARDDYSFECCAKA